MPDYYDRLEKQLSELTAQGAHRHRGLSVGLPSVRFRAGLGNVVALGASALVAVVVAAAILTVGSRPSPSHHVRPAGPVKPPVLQNVYPARLPAPSGQLSFDSRLSSPRGGKAAGEVRFYAVSPTHTEMILTASGLRKLAARNVYAVWLLAAEVQTQTGVSYLHPGVPPHLLGVVAPPVGSSGRLTITDLLPDTVNGPYKLLVTVQRRASTTTPGLVALERFVDF